MTRHALYPTTLLLLCLTPLISACHDDPTDPGGESATMVVLPRRLTLTVGERAQLSLYLDGSRVADPFEVSWESSDPQIVSVSEDGMLQALGEGEVQIEAQYNGHSAWATVTTGEEVITSRNGG